MQRQRIGATQGCVACSLGPGLAIKKPAFAGWLQRSSRSVKLYSFARQVQADLVVVREGRAQDSRLAGLAGAGQDDYGKQFPKVFDVFSKADGQSVTCGKSDFPIFGKQGECT